VVATYPTGALVEIIMDSLGKRLKLTSFNAFAVIFLSLSSINIESVSLLRSEGVIHLIVPSCQYAFCFVEGVVPVFISNNSITFFISQSFGIVPVSVFLNSLCPILWLEAPASSLFSTSAFFLSLPQLSQSPDPRLTIFPQSSLVPEKLDKEGGILRASLLITP